MIESNEKIKQLTENVKNTIIENRLVENGDKIIVAVSGGPDSTALLDMLCELKSDMNLKYELIVAHVNHMLREESEAEKEYVENLCKKYNVEFNYLKVDIKKASKEMKISEEMAGREKRYEFFGKLLKEKNANKIAVAHNLDDNVETIIMHIIRGTGLSGLTGMKYKNGNIIRPLLNLQKCDILSYTQIKGLNPCFDKSNDENIYLRNKIRNILIPELKSEYNENILQNIIRMSKIVSLDEEFLESYVSKIFDSSIVEKSNEYVVFNYKNVLLEHEAIINRYIRKLLDSVGVLDGVQNVNIADIYKLMSKNITGKKYIKAGRFEIDILKKNIAKIYIGEEL